MSGTGTEAGGIRLEHVAGAGSRYPGEEITFFTLVEMATSREMKLVVSLPAGLELHDYKARDVVSGEFREHVPEIEDAGDELRLWWDLPHNGRVTSVIEFSVEARVLPTSLDRHLQSVARMVADHGERIAEGVACLEVHAKGRYLRYLPELYEQDELMGRFLMLFESFLGPIQSQVATIHHYFNPDLTPVEVLSWLGSWLDLVLDERLPEDRRRLLLGAAVSLFRRRGTPEGLSRYLETYTGGRARIIEYRAHNLQLGADALLGPGIALGLQNQPHTFAVVLSLPPLQGQDGNGDEIAARTLARRRAIESIIEAEKPAHTGYELRLEDLPSAR